MKDMFYNYEHNITKKEYPIDPQTKQKGLDFCNKAQKLVNVKGEELGVEARVNSKFYLYFTICDDLGSDLMDALRSAELHFDVLDSKREVIASFEPELDDYASEIRVRIATSENGALKYGVYRMHLYFVLDGDTYTLFSEEDGILSIK